MKKIFATLFGSNLFRKEDVQQIFAFERIFSLHFVRFASFSAAERNKARAGVMDSPLAHCSTQAFFVSAGKSADAASAAAASHSIHSSLAPLSSASRGGTSPKILSLSF